MPIAQQTTQKGFGLLELIITLAIVAVLTSMATIALQQRLRAQQLHTAQADTLVALRFARITAIHQHRKVLFCLSSDGRHCIKEKTQRKQGWLVAYEGHGSIQSTLLRSGRFPSHIKVVTGEHYRLHFSSNAHANGNTSTATFCFSDSSSPPLSVVVSNVGRARGEIAKPAQAARCLTAP